MKKAVFILAEVLAIAALRVLLILRRDSPLPKGSKVQRIRNRPVYRFPFLGKKKEATRERLRTVRRGDGDPSSPGGARETPRRSGAR